MLLTLDCEVYHTQLGESLLDVARHFSPDQSQGGVNSYLRELITHNQANLHAMTVDPREPTLPMRPYSGVLCLLPGTKPDAHTQRLDMDLARANWMNHNSRRNLNRLLKNTNDVRTVASTAMLLGGWQRLETVGLEGVVGAAITLPHLYADYLKERAKGIKGTMTQLQDKINKFAKTAKSERPALKKAFYEELKTYYNVLYMLK